MTCIIAITDKTGCVWLAGDKLGSNGHTKQIVKDPKVFKVGDFYFGYTSSFYMGQLLKYSFVPPVRTMHVDDNEYIFRDVRYSLKALFDKNSFGVTQLGTPTTNEPDFGTFIMVYKNRVFVVQNNLSLLEYDNTSVGCGEELAKGCIDALQENTELSPEQILTKTMDIVSRYSCGVSRELDIIKCI